MSGDLLYCDTTGNMYRFVGDTSAIRDSFSLILDSVGDLAVVGQKVIVSRWSGATTIYVLDGFNPGFIDSYGFGTSNVRGCTSDGTNVIAVDSGTNTIYGLVGLTNAIDWTIAADGNVNQSMAFDGDNMITVTTNPLSKVWQHVLLTAGIITSFAAPDPFATTGLTFIKPNMVSCGALSHLIYFHIGVSANISSSRTSPGGTEAGLSYLPDPFAAEVYVI